VSRKQELLEAFEQADVKSTGVVTKYQWVNVMREVMTLHIRWIALMQVLVLDEHFKSYLGRKAVDYNAFLRSFDDPNEEGFEGELVEDEYTALVTEEGTVSNAAAAAAAPASIATTTHSDSSSSNNNSNNAKVVKKGCVQQIDIEEQEEADAEYSPHQDRALPITPKLPSSSTAPGNTFETVLESGGLPPSPEPAVRSPGKSRRVSFGATPAEVSSEPSRELGSAKTSSKLSLGDSPPTKLKRRRSKNGTIMMVPQEPPPPYCGYKISREIMEVLYLDYEQVETAFKFFDPSNSGFITKVGFRAACKQLNKYLSKEQRIRDIEAILKLMDVEETGEITLNIFFEIFRLSEIKLNVAIDEEDTLTSSLHHSEVKDIVRRASALSMSGINFGSQHHVQRLAIHGVEIHVDAEFASSAKLSGDNAKGVDSSNVGLNIDV
jgi:hypothetical protein